MGFGFGSLEDKEFSQSSGVTQGGQSHRRLSPNKAGTLQGRGEPEVKPCLPILSGNREGTQVLRRVRGKRKGRLQPLAGLCTDFEDGFISP